VAYGLALTFEHMIRIRQVRAAWEAEIHVFGVSGDVAEHVFHLAAEAEPEGDGVDAVDGFGRVGRFFENDLAQGEGEIRDVRVIGGEEPDERGERRALHVGIKYTATNRTRDASEQAMYVGEIWRYPVKSMAGERLESARLTAAGIPGDRVVQVQHAPGRIATARTWPELLGFKGTLDAEGNPLIDGKLWSDPAVLAAVRKVVGRDARLVRDESVDSRFDVLPLLVATDGAIAKFGRDVRRLRPNIVIGGVVGLEERKWEGGEIRIGDVAIGVHDLRDRCNMTMVDPDTLAYDPGVLRDIVRRFGGKLALNCEVLEGGEIRVDQDAYFLGSS
jgi:uncharacterized protein